MPNLSAKLMHSPTRFRYWCSWSILVWSAWEYIHQTHLHPKRKIKILRPKAGMLTSFLHNPDLLSPRRMIAFRIRHGKALHSERALLRPLMLEEIRFGNVVEFHGLLAARRWRRRESRWEQTAKGLTPFFPGFVGDDGAEGGEAGGDNGQADFEHGVVRDCGEIFCGEELDRGIKGK